MRVPESSWKAYAEKQAGITKRAETGMQRWMDANPGAEAQELIGPAYSLATRWGEAATELACQMYDQLAQAQGTHVPEAEPAATATVEETARAIYGTLNNRNSTVPATVGRLVKQAGADTMLQNAARDGAEFAWVPGGDSCAFCLTLASRGWQRQSKKAQTRHAEHIHANCDCEYCVRFDGKSSVEGYDPDALLEKYESFEGTPDERINAWRREIAAEKRELQNGGAGGMINLNLPQTLTLPDIMIGRSVGAKAQNYDILDPDSGLYFQLVEGSRIQDATVFAGNGTSHPLAEEVSQGLAEQIGGEAAMWQHCKGIGHIDVHGEDILAEVHWFQEETVGKHKFKIKRWLDES